jgi:hypothetical protein
MQFPMTEQPPRNTACSADSIFPCRGMRADSWDTSPLQGHIRRKMRHGGRGLPDSGLGLQEQGEREGGGQWE